MQPLHYIVATAGHVDHGKSALVKALTGTDPDRLPEEKARGITIDLGFARLTLSVPHPPSISHLPSALCPLPSATYELGVIDVPGHEDFVKNMVAGVGSIDLALLVVAANDGWMPQTEEHLQILTYLGVTRAVVALTKVDLIASESDALEAVRKRLQGSPFLDAPIIPTSTVTQQGFAELKTALVQVLQQTPPPPDCGKPRLAVDRVFVRHGAGTIVTGTLTGGTLRRGQTVVIQPRNSPARIRSLQCYNEDRESAVPGMRTALNLPDIDHESGIARGDVITVPGVHGAATVLDVLLERSSRLAGLAAGRGLKDDTRVRVHLGSANTGARITLVTPRPLEPGSPTLARLHLERPLHVLISDRFIVRDWSEQTTLAGGAVLDLDPRAGGLRQSRVLPCLNARASHPSDPATYANSALRRDLVVNRAELLAQCRFSNASLEQALHELDHLGAVHDAGPFLADAAFWQQLRTRAAAMVDAHHQSHPDQPGLSVSQLRTSLASSLPLPDCFDTLLTELGGVGYQRTGHQVHRTDFLPRLPQELQACGDQLRKVLASQGLDVPSRKQLATDPAAQHALRYLIQIGEAIELSPEIVLSTGAFQQAKDKVCQFLEARGRATTSELRQALGSSRRITIPLLELLDRQGITRRDGDSRSRR